MPRRVILIHSLHNSMVEGQFNEQSAEQLKDEFFNYHDRYSVLRELVTDLDAKNKAAPTADRPMVMKSMFDDYKQAARELIAYGSDWERMTHELPVDMQSLSLDECEKAREALSLIRDSRYRVFEAFDFETKVGFAKRDDEAKKLAGDLMALRSALFSQENDFNRLERRIREGESSETSERTTEDISKEIRALHKEAFSVLKVKHEMSDRATRETSDTLASTASAIEADIALLQNIIKTRKERWEVIRSEASSQAA